MNDLLKLPPVVLFHPAQTFRAIKNYRGQYSYLPVVVLLVLVIAVRVAYLFIVHFPLAALDPRDANILLEIAKLLVPILTWVVASYAVTSILDGEALFQEILMAAAYAMVPYLVLSLPVAAISHVLSRADLGMFLFLERAVWAWVLALFFVSVKSLHDYHVGKTILVCFLTLFAMALMWALLLLLYSMSANSFAFFKGLAMEAWMSIVRGR